MKKYLVLALLAIITFGSSCAYEPQTSWTPRKSKAMREKKSGKGDKKVRTIRMW
ncbi:MAG: hypothetical protein MUC97_10920 [Bernardetiaceae bacterium]|jgi:hypothetical protein|nr:hypothetical protein [Bernardetiaceae bacterium]